MRKIILKVTVVLMFLGLFTSLIIFAQTPDSITYSIEGVDLSNGNDLLFGSNNYTQPDNYETNTHKGSLNSSDVKIATSDNGYYELYLNRTLGIFKVRNTITNYVYSSGLDEVEDTSATTNYAKYLSSSIVLYYYKYNTKEEKLGLDPIMLPMTNAKKLTNSQKEELGGETFNFNITTSSDVKITYESIEDGMKMNLNFSSLQISLSCYVTISDDGLKVRIPDEEITEGKNLISSIVVFPTIGATHASDTKGYMVIPDGSGALIRYGECQKPTQQTLPFFESDWGISVPLKNSDAKRDEGLRLPIFGLVNGIKQDAIYGIITSGLYATDLIVNPSGGLNIKYNFLTPRFKKRYEYLLYGVNRVIQEKRNSDTIETLYRFLDNDDATYVGIANNYQDYLIENDAINDASSQELKTRLEFLMSEVTGGILGNKVMEMTSVESCNQILDELSNLGIEKFTVVLKGWNKSGYSISTPYNIKFNTKCGSKSDFKKLISTIEEKYGKCYVFNDYVYGYKDGNISLRADVARGINNLKMTYKFENDFMSGENHELLPSSTYEIAVSDIKKYLKNNISSVAIDSIGKFSYSYIEDKVSYTRTDAISYYEKTLSEMSEKLNIALYEANSYTFKYLSDYLDCPVYSSGYTLYTDCVPLLEYVLRGRIDAYSNFVNFQANGVNQLLRLLDYGVYPSYILTQEASFNLKYTMSNSLYTTKYTDFKDRIITNNNFLKEGYDLTLSKKIVDRSVLESGVVLITYSDNTNLVINYTETSYTYKGVNVESNNYKVIS